MHFHDHDLPEQLNTAPSVALLTSGELYLVFFSLFCHLSHLKENSNQTTSKSQIYPLDNATGLELVGCVMLFLQILMPSSLRSQDGDEKLRQHKQWFFLLPWFYCHGAKLL